jgi:hypothetical protein
MPRVPSRHTYLASAGLAWIVGAGFLAFRRRVRARARWLVPAAAAAVLLHNCGYIWVKKRAQYLERAAPTEALVEVARRAQGPVYIRCFPYNAQAAQLAVQMRLEQPPPLIWAVTHPGFSAGCLEAAPRAVDPGVGR